MDANPYSAPEAVPTADRDDPQLFAHALFAAFGSFGVSQFTLLIATSFLWHGQFVAFSIYDSLQITFAAISAISASAAFVAVLTQSMVPNRWIAPVAFMTVTLLVACIFLIAGFPGTGRGAIDLSPFFCGCLVATIPLAVAFTIFRYSLRRFIYATIPYMLWISTIVASLVSNGG